MQAFEGQAEILGSPLDAKNQRYAEIYREKLPRDYETFAHLPGMVLVKVTPSHVVTFFARRQSKYGYVYLEHLDIENREVCERNPEEHGRGRTSSARCGETGEPV